MVKLPPILNIPLMMVRNPSNNAGVLPEPCMVKRWIKFQYRTNTVAFVDRYTVYVGYHARSAHNRIGGTGKSNCSSGRIAVITEIKDAVIDEVSAGNQFMSVSVPVSEVRNVAPGLMRNIRTNSKG